MRAAAQEIGSWISSAASSAFQKIAELTSTFTARAGDRLQFAVSAFHDTLESRKYRSAEAVRLSQLPTIPVETARVAALLLCTTSSRVIELREGLNHFKATEQGVEPIQREEYLRGATGEAWEMKVESDAIQAWTTASNAALKGETNDIVTVLNGSYFVKVIPFELRGSL